MEREENGKVGDDYNNEEEVEEQEWLSFNKLNWNTFTPFYDFFPS